MTKRTRSVSPIRAPLTELESEVMNAVWDAGSCSVEDVHRVVSRTRDLKEATIRTLLRRLEQKGCLRHQMEGRAYIYLPVESARSLAAKAVRQIIDRFCRGSLDQLVSGMVDGRMLREDEIERWQEFVDGQRAGQP
jgi:predicted transcriptional regulator